MRAASNGQNTDQVVTVNILDANDAPVVSTPIADQNAQVGVVDTVDLSGAFSDVDAGDVLTYSVTASRTSGAGGDPLFTINAMGVLSIDASSLSGTDGGDFEVTVTATDGSLSVTDSFTLAVSDDSEPVFVGAPYAFTMAENDTAETFSGTTISATDPDGDTVTLSLVAAEGATDVPAGFVLTSGILSYSSASGIDRESLSEDGILIVRVQAESNGLTVFQDIEITITDVDEFDVVFPQATLDAFDNLSIDENLDGSTTAVPLMTVVATDDDGDSVIAYSLTNPVAGVSIDADTGALTYTGSGFNHENTDSYSFDVVATSGSKTVTKTVTLNVNDVDEGPVFVSTVDYTLGAARLGLNETQTSKTFSANFAATDVEGDTITYSLSSTLTGLTIGSTTGVVNYSGVELDQDGSNPVTSYDLTVTATSNGKSTTKDAVLVIGSVNEAPVFAVDSYDVDENASGVIFTVNAVDPEGTAVVYSLVSSPPDGFSIDSASGEVSYTGVGLDYETQDEYSLTVRAASNGQNTNQVVTVNILDVNEAPVVSAPIADYNVKIGLSQTIDITAIFSDEDGDALTYSVTVNRTSGAGGDPLVTVDAAGVLSVDASSLSVADEGEFEIEIMATDGSLSVVDNFSLTLLDDADPVFSDLPYEFTLSENDTAETFSGTTIAATDPDGDVVTLSLVAAEGATDVPAGFVLTNGILSYSSVSGIDREALPEDGVLIVRVQAAANGTTVFQDIEITITDVDEFDVVFPQATLDAFDNLSIDENLDGSTTAVPLMTVEATDGDGDSVITYSLTNPVAGVSIDTDTGDLTYTGSGFNHENTASYSFDVVATSGSNTVTKAVTLTVNDVDENAPVFTSTSPVSLSIDENDTAETFSPAFEAMDADGTNNTVTYSLDTDAPTGFSITVDTGVLSYADSAGLDAETATSHVFNVIATSNGVETKQAVTLTVSDVDESNVAFDDATYNFTLDENTDSTASPTYEVSATDADVNSDISYSITDSSVPFSIDADSGDISYTGSGVDRETTSSFSFTVSAVDTSVSNAVAATATVNIAVNDINEVPVVSDPITDRNVKTGVVDTVDLTAIFSDEDAGAAAYL